MSFSKCCRSGFTESNIIITLLKGVHMTFLKSVKSAVVLAGIAGVLMFAGVASAQTTKITFVDGTGYTLAAMLADGSTKYTSGGESLTKNDVVKFTVTVTDPNKVVENWTIDGTDLATAVTTATYDYTVGDADGSVAVKLKAKPAAWAPASCKDLTGDAEFVTCWRDLLADASKDNTSASTEKPNPGNPLFVWSNAFKGQWEIGDGLTDVTKVQAVAKAGEEVDAAKVWWTTNSAASGITFTSGYDPDFVVADAAAPVGGWTAPIAGTSSNVNGTDGTYFFAIKLKTGSTETALTGATGTVKAKAKKFIGTAPVITVVGPTPNSVMNIVKGTVALTDVITVTAAVSNVTPAGSRDNTLEYRWFKTTGSATTPANADVAAPGSNWATAAANGNIYAIPADIDVGTYYFYCRVRSTLKSPGDATKDSLAMRESGTRQVAVTTRPTITPGTATYSNGSAAQVVGAVTGTISVSGESVTGGSSSDLTYQWYYNSANSEVGGIEVLNNNNSAANGTTFTVPTSLQAGFYYYFCEVRAEGLKAAPKRTPPVLVTVKPNADATVVAALPSANVVQVNNGTAEYSRTAVMKLTTPNTGANAVSPALASGGANLSFAVVKVIYQNQISGEIRAFVDTGHAVADPPTETSGLGTLARPWPLDGHRVIDAGTYNVTVVVRSTNESGVKYEGSRTVTFTVNPKQLSALNVKSLTPASVPYDGKTKVPTVSLVDGTGANAYSLRPSTNGTTASNSANGTNGTDLDFNRKDGDLTNAGTAKVTFSGINNYTGTLELTFTITKKEIRVDTTETKKDGTQVTALGKTYDGTTTVNAARLTDLDLKFSGLVNANDLSNGSGYVVTALTYDAANAGTRVVNGTVRLDTATAAGSSLGRNYTFSGSVATASFALTGVTILRKDPAATDFDYTIPTNKFFTGAGQGIGNVNWQSKYTSTGDTRTVYYDAKDGLGAVTALPVGRADADVDYVVTLNVSGSNNFLDRNNIQLTELTNPTVPKYTIKKPQPAKVIVTNKTASETHAAAADAYIGDEFTLRTVVTRPDSASGKTPDGLRDTTYRYKGGTVTYVWYIDTTSGTTRKDTLKIGNAVVRTPTYSATFTPADTVESKTRSYFVEATYSYPTVQANVKDTSLVVVVTINKEREDIAAAVVTVTAPGGGFVYNGETQRPAGVTVKLGNTGLNAADADGNGDYTYDVFGEDAGVGVVSVTGINKYKGKASGTFEIAKRVTTLAGLNLSPAAAAAYNGAAQPVTVSPKLGTGLGAVTIKYLDVSDEDNPATLAAAPKNAGKYKAVIEIAEGKNYTELEEFEHAYTITQRFVEKSDFNYTMPKNGATPTAITATLKNPMGYTGTLTTLYRNAAGADLTAVPTTEGKYAVRVRVSGDDNFGMVVVTLDTLKIDENGKVGVKSSDREVPKSVETNVAAVAPVKVVASGFTAGPSPVSLSKDGAIKFFPVKAVKSGTLYIFDASGNAVAKKSVSNGAIAPWNLKDKKGASVTEGTYVVKGALVGKDGTKEKVSFVFSVVK